jgi:hypothetical protein
LVREAAARHERAEQTTRELLGDSTVPAICEGAFSFEDLRVRVDVLVRNGDAFDLVEVKSSTRAKPEHRSDAGVQLRVLEGAGLTINRVGILHLNTEYLWTGGEYDLDRLFALQDITAEAREAALVVDTNVRSFREALASPQMPDVRVGAHCTRPYECPFLAHCWRDVDYHHVCELPMLDAAQLVDLETAGVRDIAQIETTSIRLSPVQELARRCVVNAAPYVDAEALSAELDELEYPISTLTVAFARPALPLFEGTRPYAPIPVAWSMSSVGVDGAERAKTWTAPGDADRDLRAKFFATLSQALPASGTIVMYEPADQRSVVLAASEQGSRIAAWVEERGLALRRLVESSYYDAALAGSFTLDVVARVLAHERPLRAVIDVSSALNEWANADTTPARRAVLSDDLVRAVESRHTLVVGVLAGVFALAGSLDEFDQ